MIKVLFICHGSQFYYNSDLCRMGKSGAKYAGQHWNYYGLDY